MDTIIMSIDSEFRNKDIYPNSSNFAFEFEECLLNITKVSLSSIEFPNTFYTFTEKRDNISFTITTALNEVLKISLVEGSYTSDLLLNYIQTAFEKLNTDGLTTQTFAIEFNEITSRVTIVSDNTFSLDFNNKTEYQCLGCHLGFTKKIYNGATSYTGEIILNIIGEQYVYLLINEWGDLKAANIKNTSAFAKILLTQQKTFIIYDDRSNFITKEINFKIPEKIRKIRISLVDKYGNLIEMNQDFSLTLEFIKIYDNRLIKTLF
jgi:hypothetical protein